MFKGDSYEFDNGLEQTFKGTPNSDVDRTDYDNILEAIGIVKYQNGDVEMLSVSKKEIDQYKAKSPSAKSDYSPGKQFPLKMVEGKIMRDLVKRIVTLDRIKMALEGIQISKIDDEKVYIVKNNEVVEKEYSEVQKEINKKETGYLERQKDNYKVEVTEVVENDDLTDELGDLD